MDFNPRSHKGSDVIYYPAPRDKGNFNPRSHKGSDSKLAVFLRPSCIFQSTLPQGERPCTHEEFLKRYVISIHAPTRGATFVPFGSLQLTRSFQSTLPQGERRVAKALQSIFTGISIHAPTRGATNPAL